jgi:hypothetical protein
VEEMKIYLPGGSDVILPRFDPDFTINVAPPGPPPTGPIKAMFAPEFEVERIPEDEFERHLRGLGDKDPVVIAVTRTDRLKLESLAPVIDQCRASGRDLRIEID